MSELLKLTSIAKVHELYGLGKVLHPLVSVFQNKPSMISDFRGVRILSELYMISMKDGFNGSIRYGRNSYDFDQGVMTFISPGQVISVPEELKDFDNRGWSILFHPDLIRKSDLGKNIDRYTFFSYDIHEALCLSEDEKSSLCDIADKIKREMLHAIDQHTQKLIVSNIELLLDYCVRYFERQFFTRSDSHNDFIEKFKDLLKDYFKKNSQVDQGIPTVKYFSEKLHMSANYLSDVLKKETGKNTQEHIHNFIIERAKTELLSTSDSVTEIAFNLGFDYSQHFSTLFKNKTGFSPSEYRKLN